MKEEYKKYLIGSFIANSLDDLPYDPLCPIKKGARVEKIREDTPGGDLHPIGTRGYTIGGFMHNGIDAYFVQWDAQIKIDIPGAEAVVVGVMGWKIKEIPKKKKKTT